MIGFIRQLEIGNQVKWVGQTLFPDGDHQDRAIAFYGKPDFGKADLIVHLEIQILERERTSLFEELGVLGSPTDIAPILAVQDSLKLDPVKFSIPQKDHCGFFGQDGMHLVE